jgi:hypothetical protein
LISDTVRGHQYGLRHRFDLVIWEIDLQDIPEASFSTGKQLTFQNLSCGVQFRVGDGWRRIGFPDRRYVAHLIKPNDSDLRSDQTEAHLDRCEPYKRETKIGICLRHHYPTDLIADIAQDFEFRLAERS